MKDLQIAAFSIWLGIIVILKFFGLIWISLILLLFSAPFALWIYVRLHECYHTTSLPRMHRHISGCALASSIGFSWQLYSRHHANHHKFSNGPGDYSSTLDANGNIQSGIVYLLKNACWPWVIQLIPFISVMSMKPANRSTITWMDESFRVGLRLSAFLLGGGLGLFGLLMFQFMAVNTILYANYLQHFDVSPGKARDWVSGRLSAPYRNFGYHQHHHEQPELDSVDLRVRSQVTESYPIFKWKVLVAFLQSPRALQQVLKSRALSPAEARI